MTKKEKIQLVKNLVKKGDLITAEVACIELKVSKKLLSYNNKKRG